MVIIIDMMECVACHMWKPTWEMWEYTGDGKGICDKCKEREDEV